MADYTVSINLPDHKLGDEWIGISLIGPVVTTGITQGTLTRIRMQLSGPDGPNSFKLDSLAGYNGMIALDVTTPDEWEAHISPIAKFLTKAGTWNWSMQFFHSGDISPITLYKGALTVHDNIMR